MEGDPYMWTSPDRYGGFLRAVRQSRRLSQSRLAELVGISQPNLSAYETGRREPTLDTLNRILVACGYQLAADGGSATIHCPFPPDSRWWPLGNGGPERGDFDEPPSVRNDASDEERARAVVEVVHVAETIQRSKQA